MKNLKLIFLGAIICFNCSHLFSQTENSSLIRPFGVGLHIEQFKLNDIDDMVGAPANKIIFVISPCKSFRLEPEFGFRFGKDKTNDLKNSGLFFGLGALGMIQHNKLNIYGGLRFEYAIVKSEENNGNNVTKTTYKSNRVTIGPTIGCEYYLGNKFTFGGEVALKYATLKNSEDPKPTNYEDQKSNYFTTDTGLFIRFYF